MTENSESTGSENRSLQKGLQQELTELLDVVGPAPLVDLLLERAFQLHATDIHLDPVADGLRVRLRVDGRLHDVLNLPSEMMANVISRVKLMANMNITERRHAQDGRISNTVLSEQRDVRVGSGPTIHGERLVLRLMPDGSEKHEMHDLGLEAEQVQLIQEYLRAPYGMILSVGPVGSGKSTTMYSCMERLNDPQKSLVTIEDPVERRIQDVVQIQTDPKINFGFVEALRAVLRQDPNVMMIGEIRDPETAHIATRAALTGVLVLSTMHASDCAATIDVFREFDIPPMFIADSVNCLISQRLVRKICPESRETYHPNESECAMLGIDPADGPNTEIVRGIPSEDNFQTGYSGRTAVFEVMGISPAIREAIIKGKSSTQIREIAREEGMISLGDATRRKVLAGVTSMEELHGVMTTYDAAALKFEKPA